MTTIATEPKAEAVSAEALLKAAVSGATVEQAADAKPSDTKAADAKPSDTKAADATPSDTKAADTRPTDAKPAEPANAERATVAIKAARRLDPLAMGVAGGALALGLVVGAGITVLSTARPDPAAGLTELHAGLEANRVEANRLNTEIERVAKTLAGLREGSEAARKEAATRGANLNDRIGKMEQGLATKVATLGDRIDQAEKEHGTRIAALAAQAEKRQAAVPAPVAPKPEPVQTGSIADAKPVVEAKPVSEAKALADAKPKPSVIEGWALRDVYQGTAMLEDRRRRLVEVSAGDVLPGIGRVEAVERRGREWVVVTRQGLVTPQPW